MKYKLCRASIEPDYSHATLWYANPNCIFEEPHKWVLSDRFSIERLMRKIDIGQVNPNDLPIDKIPEDIQYIKATVVEVYIGLHKHVRKKINGRPMAQEQINRCWIPVEED